MRLDILRTAAVLLLAVPLIGAERPGGLEGRWRLVEQRFGSGQADLVLAEAPPRIEFARIGGRLAGSLWSGPDSSKAIPWPAFTTHDGGLPLRIRELSFSPDGRRVRAVYRVRRAAGGGEFVEVAEEYEALEDGKALEGTVRVTALEEGKPQGSYLLRRRFEREP
jgi:hypothetical protein